MTIEGLRPKGTYEFRIIAENKHGQSRACEPTAPIVIPEQRTRRQGRDGSFLYLLCFNEILILINLLLSASNNNNNNHFSR